MTDSAVILDGDAGYGGGDGAFGDDGAWADARAGCNPADWQRGHCAVDNAGAAPDDRYAPPAVVTIADVATFAPSLTAPASEPAGWGVAGLPVNLVGPAERSVVAATLLGAPAEVRFTPVAWRWSLGDGGALYSAVPGRTWSDLGVAEFSATGTSHVYAVRGTYRVELVVVLTAEYRVGGGAWIPVAGSLAVPAAPLDLVVGTADTVLVGRDCSVRPAGPGC